MQALRLSLRRAPPRSSHQLRQTIQLPRRQMSSPTTPRKTSVPHQVRTAAEPRQNKLHTVRLSHVEQANPSVRLLQLAISPQEQEDEDEDSSSQSEPFTFLPGQWLDVHVPSISNAGGFSITSTPADAQALPAPTQSQSPNANASVSVSVDNEETGLPPIDVHGRAPYVELAVQYAPRNPASAWFWRPKDEILGKELSIRVGGSFVWPPTGVDLDKIRNVVLVAGGVGINPLISILSHLNNNPFTNTNGYSPSFDVKILYTAKYPTATSSSNDSSSLLSQIPFLPRIQQIMRSQSQSHRLRISLDLFLTSGPSTTTPQPQPAEDNINDFTIHHRRINHDDLRSAVAGSAADGHPETVCYVCGPPQMTDEFVPVLGGLLGEGGAADEGRKRVFFEKWW